jgi:peptidoglycan/xylan/chitin deacetylase (PgdA/CDA1 family)
VPPLVILNLAGKLAAVLVFRTSVPAALLLWLVPDALLAYHTFVPNAQGLVRVRSRFRTGLREVWLTIDDGPDPEDTPKILGLLDAHGAQATFFVVGEKVDARPELARSIAEAGHEVAHHTYSHPHATFWCASPGRVGRELDGTIRSLRSIGLVPTRFRAPVGIKSIWLRQALLARKLTCVGWSARGLERGSKSAEEVAERVTRNVEPGAVLLLHEGPRVPAALRVAAIGATLERLRSLGYRCVVPTPEQLAAS